MKLNNKNQQEPANINKSLERHTLANCQLGFDLRSNRGYNTNFFDSQFEIDFLEHIVSMSELTFRESGRRYVFNLPQLLKSASLAKPTLKKALEKFIELDVIIGSDLHKEVIKVDHRHEGEYSINYKKIIRLLPFMLDQGKNRRSIMMKLLYAHRLHYFQTMRDKTQHLY